MKTYSFFPILQWTDMESLINTGELPISESVKLFQMLQWTDMKSLNFAARKTPNQRKFNALTSVTAADMKNLI